LCLDSGDYAGDFDGDGFFDCAVTTGSSGDLSFYKNLGGGTYKVPPVVTSQAVPGGTPSPGGAPVDMNGDGRADIITYLTVPATGTTTYWATRGKADGTFIPVSTNTGTRTAPSVAWAPGVAGDFNNDGRPDLFFANSDPTMGNELHWVVVSLSGDFNTTVTDSDASTALPINSVPHAAAVGDFNGDGKLDGVAIAPLPTMPSGMTPRLIVAMNNGAGGFEHQTSVVANSDGVVQVSVADANADGRLDLIAGLDSGQTTFYGDGTGGFSTTPPATTVPTAGLALWLRADAIAGDDGSAVAVWADQSGHHNDASQATVSARPVLKKGMNGLNTLNVVHFAGTTWLKGTGFSTAAATGYTFYFVARTGPTIGADMAMMSSSLPSTGSSTTGVVWGQALCTDALSGQAGWGGPSQNVPLGKVAGGNAQPNTTYYARYRKSATQWDLDGLNTGTYPDASMPSGSYNYSLGVQNTNNIGSYFQGDIAEVLVYTSALSNTDDATVKSYLKSKYGLP
jgi:hypothetical protein